MKHLKQLKSYWILCLAICFSAPALAADPPEIRLDYAYYSPSSLALKRFGWLEDAFKSSGIQVKWTLSQWGPRAMEYLNNGSLNFGSAAGSVALLTRANGSPIKAIYVYSRAERTALVVGKDSTIKRVQDLRGKKVAVLKGSEPYVFLLRSLDQFGIKLSEVELMDLPYLEGRSALEQGRVDAWMGIDPHMANSQVQAGAKLLYRNIDFISYGFLCVNEQFAKQYPQHVRTVVKAYEKARKWIIDHPAEAAQLQSEEAKIPLEVAQIQLGRSDMSKPRVDKEHQNALRKALYGAAPIFVREGLIKPDTDVNKVINDLIDPSFAQGVMK